LASLFRLEFFSNSADRTPIAEGERFLGALNSVPTGAAVTQSFPAPGVSVGQWVSATATNLNNAGGAPGDTSEFTPNFEITAAIPPAATLTADPSLVCQGSSSDLTVTIVGSGPYNLVWSDGFEQTGVTSPIVRTVSPLVTTLYFVTVSDTFGCSSVSNNATVSVNQPPTVTLVASTPSTVLGGVVTLTATPSGSGPFTLTWSDGVIQTNVAGPVSRAVTIAEPTIFSVIATDSAGCVSQPAYVSIAVGRISPIVSAILNKYCSFAI
jgi:hypothetical protein